MSDGHHPGLPAGPSAPVLAQTIAYQRDPLGVLRRARARFGPVFTLRLALKGPVVFVAAPEAVDALLHADPERAHAGEARRVILPQASPRSPFGADGEQHRATRSRMAPALSPEAMAPLGPAIAGIAAEHVATWPLHRPFRLLPRMRSLAIDVFVRTVLAVPEPDRSRALVAAIRRLLWTPGNPPLPLPGDGDGPAGAAGNALFGRRRAPVDRLLAGEIARRRASASTARDLLGCMLAAPLDTDAILDEILVVLLAAQEPPSIALTNVVGELARRPDVAARFRDGDPGVRDAIVAEALRLRPAAQAALRRLTAPATVAGHELAAGTVVALPSPLLHRDPAAFPDPDAFRPERFAGGTPPGAPYLPFGGGVRRCIGEPLARAEFEHVLPVVLERLDVRAAWPRPERMVVRGTVLVPHRSAVVRARRRARQSAS